MLKKFAAVLFVVSASYGLVACNGVAAGIGLSGDNSVKLGPVTLGSSANADLQVYAGTRD